MEVQPREIRRYITSDGRIPFVEWLDSLREIRAISKIDNRIRRVSLGNLGDYRFVGEGERGRGRGKWKGERRTLSLSLTLSLFGLTIILLICGGDKSTQEQDIRKAKEYWEEYERRENADQR